MADGSSPTPAKEVSVTNLVAQTKAALEALEPDMRRKYDEALQTVPHLVATETRILDSLRRDDMNPTAAAKSLSLHWKHRKTVFGEDRSLRPLAQTGHGVLTSDEGRVLRTGYRNIVKLLSREILCLSDRSNLKDSLPKYIDNSISWYLLAILTPTKVCKSTEGSPRRDQCSYRDSCTKTTY